MMRIGQAFRAELFGSSHGPEVGAIVHGVPAGTAIDLEVVQEALNRRRALGRRLASRRREEDRLEVDSGIVDGRADGGPIRAHVRNEDVQRSAYDRMRDTPRPGHADYPARKRFGEAADLSGGGIFSGRMTVGLVIAGALAGELLRRRGVQTTAFVRSIGTRMADVPEDLPISDLTRRSAENEVGCPDPGTAEAMARDIAEARRSGDSLGGVIECRTEGVPVGLGEPFFDSIESAVAHLAFSIPGAKGIEFGAGFSAASMRGSEHNDVFYWEGDRVMTRTNHAGGILGGLGTGMPVVFRLAIKPTPSIARRQQTVNLRSHQETTIVVGGRHDPCIVPRAVVVVESITSLALADLGLRGGFLP
jgi:chorismate synthase